MSGFCSSVTYTLLENNSRGRRFRHAPVLFWTPPQQGLQWVTHPDGNIASGSVGVKGAVGLGPSAVVASLSEGSSMAKKEQTSPRVASKAGKQLADKKSTAAQKSVAASALTQAPDKPQRKK